jgi:hypothetical protein
MNRYQRRQEEKKMTRMEMILELESNGVSVNRKANTDRILKKYSAFKEDQKKKEKTRSVSVKSDVHKTSRQCRYTIEKRKLRAIAAIGMNVIPRYKAKKR